MAVNKLLVAALGVYALGLSAQKNPARENY